MRSAAAAAGLSRLFVVGGPRRARAGRRRDRGRNAGVAVFYFETSEQAAPAVVDALDAGDLVLVKGSRGTSTDVVADRLVAELG